MTHTIYTVDDYIDTLPALRKEVFTKIVQVCREVLIPLGFQEYIQYKMPSWSVSKTHYPNGYHCDPRLPLPFVSLANQSWSINLYHMGLYADPSMYDRRVEHYPQHATHKLDMGKSCIRYKYMDDVPYDLMRQLFGKMSVSDWIKMYESKFRNK